MAMTEVFVGQSDLLGAEQQSDAARLQCRADGAAGFVIQASNWILQRLVPYRSRSYDERTVEYCRSDRVELLGVLEQFQRSDCGAGLAKSNSIRVHNAKRAHAEVAHRTRCRPNVERIAGTHQH